MRRHAFYLLLTILASFILSLFLYVLFHEGGHGLVGVLFGGTITELNLNFWNLTAHVGIDGQFSQAQNALIAVAGVGTPLLVWFVVINLLPRKLNPAAGVFTLFASMMAVNPLLAWIILPVLVLFGQRPGDDSVNFLGYTGIHPLVETVAALLLYVGVVAYYLHRVGGLRAVVATLRGEGGSLDEPAPRRTLAGLWAGVAAMVALGLATGAFSNGGSFFGDPYQAPQGYVLLAEVDLSQQDYQETSLASFNVDETTQVSLFVNPRDVNSPYIDIQLVGPDGPVGPILHAEGYRAYNDRMQMSWEIETGTYDVVFTTQKSPGVVAVYWKEGLPN